MRMYGVKSHQVARASSSPRDIAIFVSRSRRFGVKHCRSVLFTLLPRRQWVPRVNECRECRAKCRAIILLYQLARTIGINNVSTIVSDSSMLLFAAGVSRRRIMSAKIDFELLVFLAREEKCRDSGTLTGCYSLKADRAFQKWKMKVSDEPCDELGIFDEFVSSYEWRKEGRIAFRRYGLEQEMTSMISLWRKKTSIGE